MGSTNMSALRASERRDSWVLQTCRPCGPLNGGIHGFYKHVGPAADYGLCCQKIRSHPHPRSSLCSVSGTVHGVRELPYADCDLFGIRVRSHKNQRHPFYRRCSVLTSPQPLMRITEVYIEIFGVSGVRYC